MTKNGKSSVHKPAMRSLSRKLIGAKLVKITALFNAKY